MESTRFYCHILIKFEFSLNIFEKNTRISWKSFKWEPSCSIFYRRA